MKHVAAFMSEKQDWTTPQRLFDFLNDRYTFTLDAAADPDNAKCERFYTKADDALTQPWEGVVFCNPPYSTGIGAWIQKGYTEAEKGAVVVMLIPSRTDTSWWHTYVMRAATIWLIRGRLQFGGNETYDNAPFPSCVVEFNRARLSRPEFSTLDREPSVWTALPLPGGIA